MPGMYRPRQSLRHTSGNKAATIQQLTLRQDEFEPREQIVLTKSIKLPREIFITFETKKSQLLKSHCVTSLTVDARISKPLTCSRNFLVPKARVNGAEAVDMLSISECFSLPKPANDLKLNTCYQFQFEESRSSQRTSLFLIASQIAKRIVLKITERVVGVACWCRLWWELLGVGTDLISFVLSR